MATLRPFAALLPKPDLAHRICELPYDVLSTEEAREIAAGNPLSFLRISKPEIDLPTGTDPYSQEVYARGRQNFQRLIAEGALVRDAQPCFYLYRQMLGSHSQVGVVAAASCQEYLDGAIRKHELTRPDKEDDRVRHLDALDAQTGPAFLTHAASPDIDAFVRRQTATPPYVDFTARDGVRHTSWRVSQERDLRAIADLFAGIPRLYIADGHHRSAAAARVFRSRDGAGNSGGFLTVIFPHNQLRILPYNRVVQDLHGATAESFRARIERVFVAVDDAAPDPAPRRKHVVSLFLEGRWTRLAFRPELIQGRAGLDALDVTLLQDLVLGPILGIDNPRTSARVQFVGGIRGNEELERLVQQGRFACAWSLFPTRIEDLMAIADAGGIMPPKSTWFEPKLRDAMFCLELDSTANRGS